MTNRTPRNFMDLGASDRDQLTTMLRHGATRREAMGWLMMAGLGTAVAGSIVGTAGDVLAATPKKGGKLRVAFDQHGPADTLDPVLFTSTADFFRGRMFYGSLVRLQSDLSFKPELAEEVIPNADATVWTFKLRKGVEFHDGKTLTADDVLYSMNRHIGPDSTSKAASLVSMVDRWEKVNEHEVRAILNSPNADLPVSLGTFHFKIVKDGQEDFSNPVGTGPFRVAEFQPGVRAIGTRFENYWDEGAYLDELETFGITDTPARLNALRSGDIDLMMNLPARSVETVNQTDGIGVWAVKSGSYTNIAARLDMQPSGNQDVILALKHLANRRRVLKSALQGFGELGNDQPISPAYFDHCPDIPQRALDPDKARYHFQKSGLGSTPIEIVAADVVAGGVDQALYLQAEAAKIGMNVQVKKVTNDGYWGAVWMKVPFFVSGWNMRPTANIFLSLAFASTAKWNETAWQNEQFDELLVKVRSVTDPVLRKQMYCDMQNMIRDTAGQIITAHRSYIDGAADHVKGRTAVPLNNFGGSESPPYLWRDA